MGSMGASDASGNHESPSSVSSQSLGEEVRASGESGSFSWTSKVASAGHRRSNSFQIWKSQIQRAWKWSPGAREQGLKSNFNPEVLANQKRQWYQLHLRSSGPKQQKEPKSLIEHFLIIGLHSHANVEATELAFAQRKIWESQVANSEIPDLRNLQDQGLSFPTLEPQILFKYPPKKRLAMRAEDLLAFCFPEGVKFFMSGQSQNVVLQQSELAAIRQASWEVLK